MSANRRELLLGLVAVAALCFGRARPAFGVMAAPDGTAIERKARSLESRLIAPCCFSQVVGQHASPQASEMKRQIRARLRAGWSEDRILDDYAERLGERVLAAPRLSGFNWLAYLAPPAFLAAGALATARWILRHRRARGSQPPRVSASLDLADEGRRARLEVLVAEGE